MPSSLKEWREGVLFVNPEIRVIKEEKDRLVMEAVAGPLGPKMAKQGMAEERQVAYEVKDFVADELILKSKGPADDFLFIKDHRIIQVST